MKKSILPLVLLAVLIAVMSSGSLAVYSQTETLRGQLYTRVFLLTGTEKTTSYEFGLAGLTLSPGQGEKELYRFTLTNAKDSANISDYGATVSLASTGMGSALSAMKGLVFRLYDVSSESTSPIATVNSGELSLTGIHFNAGVQKTAEYSLRAVWADTGDSAAQTAVASNGQHYPIRVTITAQADQ